MGRQLSSFDNTTYSYNESGIRTSKTVGEDTTEFYLNGTNVIYQTDGTNDIYFFYDRNDEIVGFKYNNNNYFYVKNTMGDITDIADSSGVVVASYTYDPWGKVTSVSGLNLVIANLNPFRYRSYYYDSDIQMYYLQTRYYDPEVGRFINCDDVNYIGMGDTVVSFNPFAYCENNPVNYSDPTGYDMLSNIKSMINLMRSVITIAKKFDIISKKSYKDFLNALGKRESGNNYSIKNKYNYLGKYQMGTYALQDAGFKSSDGRWTKRANRYGVYNERDFLNTPSAQEAAIRYCHKKVWTYIQNYKLTEKIGTRFKGIKVTASGLLAACHLVGASAVNNMFKNNTVPSDANGTKATDYMKKFGGYNLSELWGWNG